MGQQLSFLHNEQLSRKLSSGNLKNNSSPVEHEGLLKCRSVPFRNSSKISDQPELYLEQADYSLQAILQERLNTTRLLTEEDLLKMLETLLYTLAFLEDRGVVYRDLVADNIFYNSTDGSFKLLPPELIDTSAYKFMLDGTRFSLVSPEMLIALRDQQSSIPDDVYHKSNIFMLGMIMLQASTLRPSCFCYEDDTLDILDKVVRERLQLVSELYPSQFTEMLQKMLEYDYTLRKGPKELAIQLNNYFVKSHKELGRNMHQKGNTRVDKTKPYLMTHPHSKFNQTQGQVYGPTQAPTQEVQANSSQVKATFRDSQAGRTIRTHTQPVEVRYVTPPKNVIVNMHSYSPAKPIIQPIHQIQQQPPVHQQPTQNAPWNPADAISPRTVEVRQVNTTPPKRDIHSEPETTTPKKQAEIRNLQTEIHEALSKYNKHPRDPYTVQKQVVKNQVQVRHIPQEYHRQSNVQQKTVRFQHIPHQPQNRQRTPMFPHEQTADWVPNNWLSPSRIEDSPIRAKQHVPEESVVVQNRRYVTRHRQQSTDYSINRIKEQIEKSRRLIQQFQMRSVKHHEQEPNILE